MARLGKRDTEVAGWTRQVTLTVPTFRGWVVAAVAGLVLIALVLRNVHGFLALSAPIGRGVLVVEGWLPDSAMTQVLAAHAAGDYRAVVATGGPVPHGSYLRDFGSFAEMTARTLETVQPAIGTVIAIPAPEVDKDRTFASVLPLRAWMLAQSPVVDKVDVVTYGVHARRSRLLFSLALGDDVDVGVIALPPEGYDAEAWWRYSAGVRTVVGEVLAYGYAKVVFWP